MTDAEGIAAARKELQSYLVARDQAEELQRRSKAYRRRLGEIPSKVPQIGLRKSWRMVSVTVTDPATGKALKKKRREPALVPCHISVQTQPNPHREEEAIAEHSYLSFECREQIKKSQEILEKLKARIGAVRYPLCDILRLRYLEGLTLMQITQALGLFYSYRQIKRISSEAIEEYARLWGFIKRSCE